VTAYWLIFAAAIEFAGAIIITFAAVGAIMLLIRQRSIGQAKTHMATGAITGLDFKLAATLLKALTLLSWKSIGMFAAIYAIRFTLKQAFSREQKNSLSTPHLPIDWLHRRLS
jgi:uncharacterized membrane protein